jgi:hypothetical protein
MIDYACYIILTPLPLKNVVSPTWQVTAECSETLPEEYGWHFSILWKEIKDGDKEMKVEG